MLKAPIENCSNPVDAAFVAQCLTREIVDVRLNKEAKIPEFLKNYALLKRIGTVAKIGELYTELPFVYINFVLLALEKEIIAHKEITYKITPVVDENNKNRISHLLLTPIISSKSSLTFHDIPPKKDFIKEKEELFKKPPKKLFFTYGTLAGEILRDICQQDNNISIMKNFSHVYSSYTNKIKMLELHQVTDLAVYRLLLEDAKRKCEKLFYGKAYITYAFNCLKAAYKKHLERNKIISFRQAQDKVFSATMKLGYNKRDTRITKVEHKKWGWIFDWEFKDIINNENIYLLGASYIVHKNGYICNTDDIRDSRKFTAPLTPSLLEGLFLSLATREINE